MMLSKLKFHLPDYEIGIIASDVYFNCAREDFYATYPLGFMMELYRQNLIEKAFVLPAIVPN